MVSRAGTSLSNAAMAEACVEYNAPALGYINQNYLGANKNSDDFPGIKFPKYTEAAQIPESMATTITNISKYYQGDPSAIRASMMNQFKANISKFKPYNYLEGDKERAKVRDRDNEILNGFRQSARDKVDNNFINLSQGVDVIKQIIAVHGIQNVAMPQGQQSTNGSSVAPYNPPSAPSYGSIKSEPLRSSQAPSNASQRSFVTVKSQTQSEADYIQDEAERFNRVSNAEQGRYLMNRIKFMRNTYGNDFNQEVALKASDVQSKARFIRIDANDRMSLFLYRKRHLGLPMQPVENVENVDSDNASSAGSAAGSADNAPSASGSNAPP